MKYPYCGSEEIELLQEKVIGERHVKLYHCTNCLEPFKTAACPTCATEWIDN